MRYKTPERFWRYFCGCRILPPVLIALHGVFLLFQGDLRASAPVSFSRDILPISFRPLLPLSTAPNPAIARPTSASTTSPPQSPTRDGMTALVPGDLAKSEVWQRLISTDEDEVMPPPDSHRKPLTEAERDRVKRWIEGVRSGADTGPSKNPVRSRLSPRSRSSH